MARGQTSRIPRILPIVICALPTLCSKDGGLRHRSPAARVSLLRTRMQARLPHARPQQAESASGRTRQTGWLPRPEIDDNQTRKMRLVV